MRDMETVHRLKFNVGDRVIVNLRNPKRATVVAADRDSVTLRWRDGGEIVVDEPQDLGLIRKGWGRR